MSRMMIGSASQRRGGPPNPPPPEPKRATVLSISSQVVRGSVGNRALVFALEFLGHPVWSLPTVVLPWHPGQGPGTRITAGTADFAALCAELAGATWLGEVGAVITGYFGDDSQIGAVVDLIRAVKATNASAIYLCDPVLGDGGRLYQSEAILDAVRDQLLPIADIATPNRFELEFLTGLTLTGNDHLIEAARTLGPETVLVTSAFGMLAGSIGNLLVDDRTAILAEHRIIPGAPNGAGDLTAALFLARHLEGLAPEQALRRATASVFEIMARTARRGANEMTLETDADSLRNPMAMVQMRHLATRTDR